MLVKVFVLKGKEVKIQHAKIIWLRILAVSGSLVAG